MTLTACHNLQLVPRTVQGRRMHRNMPLSEAAVMDQANTILYFSSDEARAVTGQALIVDHGTTL